MEYRITEHRGIEHESKKKDTEWCPFSYLVEHRGIEAISLLKNVEKKGGLATPLQNVTTL